MFLEATEIVNGAMESFELFDTHKEFRRWVDCVGIAAHADGLPTEVFVVEHLHDYDDGECSCVQYLTDHRPYATFNVED